MTTGEITFYAGYTRDMHVAQLAIVRRMYTRRGTKAYAAVSLAENALNLGKDNAAVLIEDALWEYSQYTGMKDHAAFHFMTSALIFAQSNPPGNSNYATGQLQLNQATHTEN